MTSEQWIALVAKRKDEALLALNTNETPETRKAFENALDVWCIALDACNIDRV